MRLKLKLACVALVAAIAGLSGCGGSSEGGGVGGAGGGETVTVSSVYGDVVAPANPKRIVVLSGLQNLQPLLALDVKPLAFGEPRYTAAQLEQMMPWLDQGVITPEMIKDNLGDPVVAIPENVAALEPDLILGTIFQVPDQNMYEQLSKIAPTFAGTVKSGLTPTDELIQTYGKLTGKEDEATAIIKDLESAGWQNVSTAWW